MADPAPSDSLDALFPGRQAAVIDAATAALAHPAVAPGERFGLLDRRAEALIAEGRFADALLDAEAMRALAEAK